MSDSLQSLFSRCDSVLVFDTETSGLSWQRDEIIEFSAIRLTASGTEEVDEFIRCTRSLPPRIVELTGITDELLREEGIGKQAFAELLAALLTPGTMLAAYNAQFDLLFLYSFLQKYGDARPAAGQAEARPAHSLPRPPRLSAPPVQRHRAV